MKKLIYHTEDAFGKIFHVDQERFRMPDGDIQMEGATLPLGEIVEVSDRLCERILKTYSHCIKLISK